MEHLTLEEKLKIRDSMSFAEKLGLMETLYEMAISYKNSSHLDKPIVDNAIMPQDVKDFLISQGFVFYDWYESETNKIYRFEFIGKVEE